MFRITSFWAALICAALALAVAEPSINCSCYCCDTTNPAHANSSSNPDTTQLYTRAMGDGLGSVAIHVILVMVAIVDYYIRANHSITGKELELELIQTQMAQKPMLRAEVYAHAMRASQNRKKEVRREKKV